MAGFRLRRPSAAFVFVFGMVVGHYTRGLLQAYGWFAAPTIFDPPATPVTEWVGLGVYAVVFLLFHTERLAKATR